MIPFRGRAGQAERTEAICGPEEFTKIVLKNVFWTKSGVFRQQRWNSSTKLPIRARRRRRQQMAINSDKILKIIIRMTSFWPRQCFPGIILATVRPQRKTRRGLAAGKYRRHEGVKSIRRRDTNNGEPGVPEWCVLFLLANNNGGTARVYFGAIFWARKNDAGVSRFRLVHIGIDSEVVHWRSKMDRKRTGWNEFHLRQDEPFMTDIREVREMTYQNKIIWVNNRK